MIVVIIAGGSGSRLWPLSTPSYPKQLLKVNGDTRSLLQNTYDRACRLTDPASVYIVPEISLMSHVKEQLPDMPEENFVIEPARRNTSSCIVAALAHVAKHHDPDEPIVVLSADHYVRDVRGFVQSFKIASRISKKEGRIVLVGVEPDYPATGFGYIKKADSIDEKSFVFEVDSFKEKPDRSTAQSYMRSGEYLWNCGYFVGSLNTFKQKMETYAPTLLANFTKLSAATPGEYEEVYLKFDNISIDYALIEKVSDLLVVPASFDWMDMGSFTDLAKAVDTDDAGNHVTGHAELEEVENSFVQNYEEKPVAVIGLDNVVVVNTPHGIVVARKDLSQKIGDISKRFQ